MVFVSVDFDFGSYCPENEGARIMNMSIQNKIMIVSYFSDSTAVKPYRMYHVYHDVRAEIFLKTLLIFFKSIRF